MSCERLILLKSSSIKRKLMRKIAATLLFMSLFSGLFAQHFITDADLRKEVQQDYLRRLDMLNDRTEPLLRIFDDEEITTEESEALMFLYAYMPLSDLADYNGEFFLMQVRKALEARDHFPWGRTIPEDIFRHYVLVYRVNNENLDNAREVFFKELKPRLEGLSMYDAALEVNHWCHEKVAYRASDARTSSPLATVRTALGRCGEESTFTVTAMRAVGIPARQCYTPRWAHTDDNHAWVEVWVDGKWHFLGACEPDPELDMGWFAAPATRTMMVHSNCFGKYYGSEEVNLRTDLFSRVNMLPNYTETKKITITVTDPNGKAVEGATVKFKLYNYAEYYPIATSKTDAEGHASVTTGLGDLLIWATNGNEYGYQKIDVRQTTQLTVALNRKAGEEYVEELTIVPPAGSKEVKTASPEKAALNARRLQYEDSVRNAYTATFKTEKEGKGLGGPNLTEEQAGYFLKKSEGNYEVIIKFIFQYMQDETMPLYDYLNSLSDKDLRDIDPNILEKHVTRYHSGGRNRYPYNVYLKGIISPRISNEGLTAWRNSPYKPDITYLAEPQTAKDFMRWIQDNIVVDDAGNYFNCPISPDGVYQLRRADRHSRDIFFVACCRAYDIPAYLDNANGQIFVWEKGSWMPVSFSDNEEKKMDFGKITIDYQGNGDTQPGYWTHYTLARFEDGDFVTYDYEDDPRVAQFPFTLEVPAGYYMLSTGNRNSEGTVLSRLEFFNIPADKAVSKTVILRDFNLVPEGSSYGHIDPDLMLPVDGAEGSIRSLSGVKQLIVCFIDPTREPTKHLLKEMSQLKREFERQGNNILFVVPSDKLAPDFHFEAWDLPHSQLIEDIGNRWTDSFIEATGHNFRNNFPAVFVIGGEGNILFFSEGYSIGTGNLIVQPR